jgi:hypothetical protein
MDLLSWFVEVWFSARDFFKAQENGHIPCDEPFDPAYIIRIPDKKERFPLWLSLGQRAEIKRLCDSGKCKDPIPSELIGADEEDNYRAIAFLRINDQVGVCVETGMRSQQFPVVLDEIVSELVINDLYEELMAVLNKKSQAEPLSQIDKKIKIFEKRYKTMKYAGIA